MTLLADVSKNQTTQSRLARAALIALAAIVVFAVLSALVNARDFADLDLTVARAFHSFDSPVADLLSEALAVVFSGELSLIYALVIAAYFWRQGRRFAAVASLAFLPLVLVEVVLKYLVNQPPIPDDLFRGLAYPLATVTTQGSFPSGHAARAAFFALFLGTRGRTGEGLRRWLAPSIAAILLLACGLSRLYEEVHWASDVLAGTILGAGVGYFVACLVDVLPGQISGNEARS